MDLQLQYFSLQEKLSRWPCPLLGQANPSAKWLDHWFHSLHDWEKAAPWVHRHAATQGLPGLAQGGQHKQEAEVSISALQALTNLNLALSRVNLKGVESHPQPQQSKGTEKQQVSRALPFISPALVLLPCWELQLGTR